mgnify:FL=1
MRICLATARNVPKVQGQGGEERAAQFININEQRSDETNAEIGLLGRLLRQRKFCLPR